MGTEIVAYCAQPILNDDGSDSPTPSHDVPRQRSQSIDCGTRKRGKKKNSKSLRKYKANKAKHRRVSYANVTEEESDSMEIELRQKENAIKLLRKQNEYLRKQNEHFLSQYGSHFRTNSCNEKKTNSLSTTPTNDNASQISYSHSNTGSVMQPDALRSDINQPHSVSTKPYSP
eukprot:537649_1